jgi:regulator of sirC expression with transglutaminase-like and TPR domain
MHLVRLRCVCVLFAVIILLAAACSKDTREKTVIITPTILTIDDTLSLQEACVLISARLCPELRSCDTSSPVFFNHVLDSTAEAITKNIGNRKTGPETLAAILDAVYGSWNIGFDPRDTIIETLLPHFVFTNRKGACLGVSLIILMLAEKLNCPVYGVMLPGHFFCRFDDGNRRINIEPNKQGYAHPDDYYRQHYPCEHQPGYGLANLDKKAVIGVLCYNAGALCLNLKLYDGAIFWYQESVRRIPDFAEAAGNLAVTYAKKGNVDTALTLFDGLFTAYPDMINLALNYGSVAAAAKQYTRAVEIYRKGLDYFPNDTPLRKRMEKIQGGIKYFSVNKKKE